MKKFDKQLVVHVDKELSDWLESKALEGYKKATLVRHILRECMQKEAVA